ncbi:MAG: hypothetical protein IIA59_12450 [Candidatus Marinimicrobia bacterium]|nr:hypothetical protein [Candidatus Neomarinimicrobiota bacterium]
MEASALFEKVRQSAGDEGESSLPAWSDLDGEKQARIAPVLERLALIRSLDENKTIAGKDSDDTRRITALDINLLITCLEMLAGEPEAKPIAPASEEPAAKTQDTAAPAMAGPKSTHGSSLDVSGGEPAADPVAVAQLQGDVSAELLLEVQQAEKERVVHLAAADAPVTPVVAQPEPVESRSNSLRHLFVEILDRETQIRIATQCWVYVDDPIEEWDALQLVKVGFNESSSDRHRRLSDARTRWDVLTQKQRLEEIADVCQSLRREYTRGNVFRPSARKFDPVPANLRAAGAAAVVNHISYMSDSAYEAMERSDEYHQVAQENIKTQLKDGELYVRNGAISSTADPSWLEPFLKLATNNSDQGETIIQDNFNRGLVVPDKKFVKHLEDWLMSALRSVAA